MLLYCSLDILKKKDIIKKYYSCGDGILQTNRMVLFCCLFISMQAICAAHIRFIQTLRSGYDPGKDVGFFYGQRDFRRHPSLRPAINKRTINQRVSSSSVRKKNSQKVQTERDLSISKKLDNKSYLSTKHGIDEGNLTYAQHRYDRGVIVIDDLANRPWKGLPVNVSCRYTVQAQRFSSFVKNIQKIKALRNDSLGNRS